MIHDEKLKILRVYGADVLKFVQRLSASDCDEDCSYIFFLNSSGRYIADCFFIRSLQYFIAPKIILQNLLVYLTKMDVRKALVFHISEEVAFFSKNPFDVAFPDPRMQGNYICLSLLNIKNREDYDFLRMKFKLAEFQDFIFEKSIVLNYGYVKRFISLTKGCYPGQELVARFASVGSSKTVDVVNVLDSSVLQVLLSFDGNWLVYKKLF